MTRFDEMGFCPIIVGAAYNHFPFEIKHLIAEELIARTLLDRSTAEAVIAQISPLKMPNLPIATASHFPITKTDTMIYTPSWLRQPSPKERARELAERKLAQKHKKEQETFTRLRKKRKSKHK
jgi:hypothetical protein